MKRLVIGYLLLTACEAHAFQWRDLWFTPDQQAGGQG